MVAVQNRPGSFVVHRSSSGLLKQIEWIPEVIPSGDALIENYLATGQPMGLDPWDIVDSTGLTEFQKSVYRATCAIPHGETRTYAWVACKIGNPKAVRAVGQALRRNPFPVLIPCHRVVSTGKTLGGFMGTNDPGQIEVKLKSWLIELERNFISPMFSFYYGACC